MILKLTFSCAFHAKRVIGFYFDLCDAGNSGNLIYFICYLILINKNRNAQ